MPLELVTPLPPGAPSHTRLARHGARLVVLREILEGTDCSWPAASPGLVTLQEVGELQGKRHALFAWVPGVTLRETLEALEQVGRPAPIGLVGRVIIDAARALAAAQPARPHGGLSDGALQLGFDGAISVLDWGAPRTSRFRPLGRVNFAADVFALGAVLHASLTGYQGAYAQLPDTLPTPSTLHSEASTALDAIVLKAISAQPDDRHANVGGLADELEVVLGDQLFSPGQVVELVRATFKDRIKLLQSLGGIIEAPRDDLEAELPQAVRPGIPMGTIPYAGNPLMALGEARVERTEVRSVKELVPWDSAPNLPPVGDAAEQGTQPGVFAPTSRDEAPRRASGSHAIPPPEGKTNPGAPTPKVAAEPPTTLNPTGDGVELGDEDGLAATALRPVFTPPDEDDLAATGAHKVLVPPGEEITDGASTARLPGGRSSLEAARTTGARAAFDPDDGAKTTPRAVLDPASRVTGARAALDSADAASRSTGARPALEPTPSAPRPTGARAPVDPASDVAARSTGARPALEPTPSAPRPTGARPAVDPASDVAARSTGARPALEPTPSAPRPTGARAPLTLGNDPAARATTPDGAARLAGPRMTGARAALARPDESSPGEEAPTTTTELGDDTQPRAKLRPSGLKPATQGQETNPRIPLPPAPREETNPGAETSRTEETNPRAAADDGTNPRGSAKPRTSADEGTNPRASSDVGDTNPGVQQRALGVDPDEHTRPRVKPPPRHPSDELEDSDTAPRPRNTTDDERERARGQERVATPPRGVAAVLGDDFADLNEPTAVRARPTVAVLGEEEPAELNEPTAVRARPAAAEDPEVVNATTQQKLPVVPAPAGSGNGVRAVMVLLLLVVVGLAAASVVKLSKTPAAPETPAEEPPPEALSLDAGAPEELADAGPPEPTPVAALDVEDAGEDEEEEEDDAGVEPDDAGVSVDAGAPDAGAADAGKPPVKKAPVKKVVKKKKRRR